MTERWGAVWTAPQNEQPAPRAMVALCLDSFAPRLLLRSGLYPLFHRYVLVFFDPQDPHLWHDIRDTRGVAQIVGGEFPRAVPSFLVDSLRVRVGDDDVISAEGVKEVLNPILAGDEVRITDDSTNMTGHMARVVWASDTHVSLNLDIGTILDRITLLRSQVEVVHHVADVNEDQTREEYLMRRIRTHLRTPGASVSVVRRLGCSIANLASYLEGLFSDKMSWANWGTVWRLDYRRTPFGLSGPARERAFHFSNLRPLPAGDYDVKAGM